MGGRGWVGVGGGVWVCRACVKVDGREDGDPGVGKDDESNVIDDEAVDNSDADASHDSNAEDDTAIPVFDLDMDMDCVSFSAPKPAPKKSKPAPKKSSADVKKPSAKAPRLFC